MIYFLKIKNKNFFPFPILSNRLNAFLLVYIKVFFLMQFYVRATHFLFRIKLNLTILLGHAKFGPCVKDEELLASDQVVFLGQVIGLILADDRTTAKKAAGLVEIEYEPLEEVITIQDAIERDSFFADDDLELKVGKIDERTFKIEPEFEGQEFVFEGKCRIGGQEHFYFETHGCLVIPVEGDELIVYSSTQNPTETQMEIAAVLGIPQNRVVCKVKRIGGGFGGKESRATYLSVLTAVCSSLVKRPVRCILERDVDMLISGKRHSFWADYKIRVDKDGSFKALTLDMIANAGCSLDLSKAIMERAIAHCDNVYKLPILHVLGRLAKTNVASNTA